jgi:hypothetical protein
VRALVVALLIGCTPTTEPPKPGAPATGSTTAAAQPQPKGEVGDVFGKKPDVDTPFVALADILKDPKQYNGKRVRTKGQVVAVCQAAGCWCDLKPEDGNAVIPTHVTMHDHAFFLPKTAKTKTAEIEGTIAVRELSKGEVDHYNSEGASLVAGSPVVNVDALGVVLR